MIFALDVSKHDAAQSTVGLVFIKRLWDMFDNTNTIQNIEHHIRAIFTVVRIQKKIGNAGSHKVGKPFN